MRRPRAGKVRRKDQIGFSKVLLKEEQQAFWDYLRGRSPSAVTGRYIDSSSLRTKRITLICQLFLSTGLRETELAQLRVQDTPMVVGTNVIEVYRGKNNKDRTIPVARELAEDLEEYITEIRPRTMLRHVKRSDKSRPIFYNRDGRPYTQTVKVRDKKTGKTHVRVRTSAALYRKIRRIGEHAGIAKHVYPHMLRHTFAMNALMNGVDIYTLQQLMGHSNIAMTARYLHLANSQLKGLGEKLYFRA
ncbi:MAG: tyrosine-type recombinase/integrase [Planctomycetota bacterium]|jgi:site-specific recombinase XerD